MKILFVYSLDDARSVSRPLQSYDEIYFGLSYISSLLKKHGHTTRLTVLGSNREKESLALFSKILKVFKPDVVGFSSIASQYTFISRIAESTRNLSPDTFLIAGGAHITINPESTITGPFDAICVGEGEFPMLELVNQLDAGKKPAHIPNIWFKREDGIEKNPNRPFMDKLDQLPVPDRDMWREWISEEKGSRLSILLGRGCPFLCTYCCNHALRKVSKGKYVRFRSPDDIVEEIRLLHKKYPEHRNYHFEVEAFNIKKKWFIDLCSKLEALNSTLAEPLFFGTNIRIAPNYDFDTLFAWFAKANIHRVTVGLESGNERIRRQIMNRVYSNQDIIHLAGCARKYHIQFGFQNMIGLPTETEEEFLDTIRVNRECQPDWYFLSIFFPYQGTKLAELCEEMNIIGKNIDSGRERSKVVLNSPDFPPDRIIKHFIWFDYNVYKGKKPLIKIMARMARNKLASATLLNNIYRKITGLPLFHRLKAVLRS